MSFETSSIIEILPLLGLYAETHFRFGGWTPSLLFKKEPEIIFDMPKRVDSGKDVPVFLQLNDFNKYPISFNNLTIILSQNNKSNIVFNENNFLNYELKHNFSKKAPTYVFWLKSELFSTGHFYLTCKLEFTRKKKRKFILNNNLRTSKKGSLKGFYSKEKLPGKDKCIYGDLHVHSQYTESHVEFCPPIKAIDIAASSFGLDFLAITDHSYDLSCSIDNYLIPDNNNKRWQLFQEEFENTKFKTEIIPGEEISAINSDKKIIHLGGLGLKTFVPGSADGARKKVSKISNCLTISDACNSIHNDKGISFAAHPGAQSRFLQSFLLKRGIWKETDLNDDIDAFQAVNNGFRIGWYRARKLWIRKLLSGSKLPLIAGNDSHGDFNKYIALKTPFFIVSDLDKRYLGFGKTGIYTSRLLNSNSILQYIKDGKTFVTTGPFVEILDTNENSLISNNTVNISKCKLEALSTEEFGQIDTVRIFAGSYKTESEQLIILKNNLNTFNYKLDMDLNKYKDLSYLRAEVICNDIGLYDPAMAATSPIYLVS